MKKKITGIKKAVGEYKNWIKRDWGYVAKIMLDVSTGEVWTDCFISSNDWKEYHSSNIICISSLILQENKEISMKTVREYAELKIK